MRCSWSAARSRQRTGRFCSPGGSTATSKLPWGPNYPGYDAGPADAQSAFRPKQPYGPSRSSPEDSSTRRRRRRSRGQLSVYCGHRWAKDAPNMPSGPLLRAIRRVSAMLHWRTTAVRRPGRQLSTHSRHRLCQIGLPQADIRFGRASVAARLSSPNCLIQKIQAVSWCSSSNRDGVPFASNWPHAFTRAETSSTR